MASSSALCVLGLARFTSSASSSCVNIGPFLNEKAPLAASNTDTPMMSAGSRSLVNCTRCQARPSTCASACASVVLPTPGTSSMSRWPRASRQVRARRTASGLPRMTLSSAARAAVIDGFWAEWVGSRSDYSPHRHRIFVTPLQLPPRRRTRSSCTARLAFCASSSASARAVGLDHVRRGILHETFIAQLAAQLADVGFVLAR